MPTSPGAVAPGSSPAAASNTVLKTLFSLQGLALVGAGAWLLAKRRKAVRRNPRSARPNENEIPTVKITRKNPPRSWKTVRATYFASVGPNPSHFGHTVTVHDRLRDAKAAVAKRPSGWVYALIAGKSTGYENLGRKVVAASDPQTREYATQYCEKVSRNPSASWCRSMRKRRGAWLKRRFNRNPKADAAYETAYARGCDARDTGMTLSKAQEISQTFGYRKHAFMHGWRDAAAHTADTSPKKNPATALDVRRLTLLQNELAVAKGARKAADLNGTPAERKKARATEIRARKLYRHFWDLAERSNPGPYLKIASTKYDNDEAGWRQLAKDAPSFSRQELIRILVWNDRNGTYTDEDCKAEGMDPLTKEEALEHLRETARNI